MNETRADLHMHGSIGFQPYWLARQGYAGKNLLKLIADECFAKGITISAITSHADKIDPLGVQDRFGLLKEHEIRSLPRGYSAEPIGKEVLVVEKDGRQTYLVNGQTVMPRENGKKYDMLVVGSNQVPNGMSWADTFNYCDDRGLIKVAEHPFVEAHRGMRKDLLEKYATRFDAIEGHNAQAALPSWLGKLPKVGKIFSRAGKDLNEAAKDASKKLSVPWIAVSDAHRIEDLGIAYIEWDGSPATNNQDSFIRDLKERVRSGNYNRVCGYESPMAWFGWTMQFMRGLSRPNQDREVYVPSHSLK